MIGLFDGTEGRDPLFNAVKNPKNQNSQIAREFVEKLWRALTGDVPKKFTFTGSAPSQMAHRPI